MFRGPIRDAAINRTAGTRLPSLCVENGSGPLPARNGPAIGVDVGVFNCYLMKYNLVCNGCY